MHKLSFIKGQIAPLDEAAMAAVKKRQDMLTKPRGSLGRLEDLVTQLAGIQRTTTPTWQPAAAAVFAGDHGVVKEGVSAYPAEVTAQMIANFLNEGAAVSVLARQMGMQVYVVDVGVNSALQEMAAHPRFLAKKVRPGTANMVMEPAMTEEEVLRALAAGAEVARLIKEEKGLVLAIGEMGIGNTTAATALLCAVTGTSPSAVTGFGTGIDAETRKRKIAVIEKALARHLPACAGNPLSILQTLGGLEIAAMTGCMLQAAALGMSVLIDGLICTSAALIACAMEPLVRHYLIPSHLSQEPGHQAMLAHLQMKPLLHLDMRLGEGSGAVLALPIVEAACRLLTEMATFAEAGVSDRE